MGSSGKANEIELDQAFGHLPVLAIGPSLFEGVDQRDGEAE
jgi:hypothetical protein